MELLLTWIEVAYSLTDFAGQSMKPIEDAFDTLDKTREKVNEAKRGVELLQAKSDPSDEEIHDISQAYYRLLMQIKREHAALLLRTIECIIACLRSISQAPSPSMGLFEDIRTKAQSTQLEKILSRSHKETYSKFEHALKRVLQSS